MEVLLIVMIVFLLVVITPFVVFFVCRYWEMVYEFLSNLLG